MTHGLVSPASGPFAESLTGRRICPIKIQAKSCCLLPTEASSSCRGSSTKAGSWGDGTQACSPKAPSWQELAAGFLSDPSTCRASWITAPNTGREESTVELFVKPRGISTLKSHSHRPSTHTSPADRESVQKLIGKGSSTFSPDSRYDGEGTFRQKNYCLN